jgi:toxin YoeB
MRIVFTHQAWSEYVDWQRLEPRVMRRVNDLIDATSRDPFVGIGKPEPLRHQYAGHWSRRIDERHRLVYRVEAGDLVIVQLRNHYDER